MNLTFANVTIRMVPLRQSKRHAKVAAGLLGDERMNRSRLHGLPVHFEAKART